ncbi:hypothetical protein ACR5MH_0550 (plasmid) [Streptomyces sp. L7]|uniref:hypothetical protein n=1 Tax=Streptomyces sp. L7 TaxID=3423954 RepID=UPI000E200D5A|nr:hypothetical protein DOE76_14955 [Leifsonia sp. ku-ls]
MSAAREEQFRASIARLSQDPSAFLASDDLAPFIEDLRRELIPSVHLITQRNGPRYRKEHDDDDLVNLLLVAMIGDPEKCRYLAENAASPFSYARTFLPVWLGAETGHRRNKVSIVMEWVEDASIVMPAWTVLDPVEIVEREGATVDEAVALTVRTLLPRTPAGLAGQLPRIVDWMTDNTPTHSGHEGAKLEEAAAVFPSVSKIELQAIGNITWGGRGRERETSLLGAFLLNRDFDPRTSATHRVALRLYASRVRQLRVLAGLAR